MSGFSHENVGFSPTLLNGFEVREKVGVLMKVIPPKMASGNPAWCIVMVGSTSQLDSKPPSWIPNLPVGFMTFHSFIG